MRRSIHTLVLSTVVSCLLSCGRGGDGVEGEGEATATEGPETGGATGSAPVLGRHPGGAEDEVGGPARIQAPDLADDTLVIHIAGRDMLAGSETGYPGRNPASEQDLVTVTLGSFSIDRYPYPNRKDTPPRTGVTFDEARRLCEDEGKRLCTELEWEAACKGPTDAIYPYGSLYDGSLYSKGLDAFASGYGVAGMGAVLEWTDSEFKLPENPVARGQVLRGASPDAGQAGRRCASRGYSSPERSSVNIGFRCCSGDRNEAVVTLEPLQKPFSQVEDMAPEKFSELVKAIPELSRVHAEPQMFGESDLSYVLLRRNIDPDKQYPGYIFSNMPVWWHPVRGEELLAIVGYSGNDAFAATLYHLGDGRFKHAASMVVLGNEETSMKAPLPLILVAGVDAEVLNWGPCWNCSEGGAFYLSEEDGTIQVTHRW